MGTGLVGAPECGDVMKLQIKVNPETGVIEDAKFKTFGCGSAIASSQPGHRVAQGQDGRRGGQDQEHRHREGAEAAAGEDPLLGAGRGRDQGGAGRLQGQARIARPPRPHRNSAGEGGPDAMAVALSENASKQVKQLKEAQNLPETRLPPDGRQGRGLLGHELQPGVRQRDAAPTTRSSRSTASRSSSTRRATST